MGTHIAPESADSMGDSSADSYKTYILSHTNGRSINNKISSVMNHLIGMGLKPDKSSYIHYF